ncbi:S9 family peptidase [Streptomyces sp. NPDC059479]|uniref:S9 family peptidase n=1 Tax=Streptomyces sp. NPDC059479 TaxID=3346848 RepID=UPI0036822F95
MATERFDEVEQHFLRLHAPAFGSASAAADPVLRPDGKAVAFTGTVFTELAGTGTARVCLAEGGEVHVLTEGDGHQRMPRYSPDGGLLAYLTDAGRAGDFHVVVTDTVTRSVVARPQVPGSVEYLEWSPDGTAVLLGVAGYGADRAGGQGSGTTAKAADEAPAWMPEVLAGPTDSGWRSAWVVRLDSEGAAEAAQVSAPTTNVWEAGWAGPDAIVCVASAAPGEESWYSADLRRIALLDGSETLLYTSDRQLGLPTSSPSGRRTAVVEAMCSDRQVVAGDLVVLTLDAHDGTRISTRRVDTHGVDVTSTGWIDEHTLGLAGLRGMETVVGSHTHGNTSFTENWHSGETVGGRYPGIDFSARGFAGVLHSYTRFPELVMLEGTEIRTIASLRHPGADYLTEVAGTVETVTWSAPDGLRVQGLLCTPGGPGPYPLVVHLHGGPVWSFRNSWSLMFPYTPLLVSQGYAVLHPNPRGSSGRGQPFAEAVFGDMGGADMHDILSGVDALVDRGLADPDRIGVMGGSYGGFMSAWLITQDQRFAAAVPMAPVTDWISQHHTSNIPDFDRLVLRDDPRSFTGRYVERSPLRFADRVRTPTLQTAGALDRCTPPGQALEFHRALEECGVESSVVIYPQEGHGVRSFPALIDQCARILTWFTRHIPATPRDNADVTSRDHSDSTGVAPFRSIP